MSEAFQKKIIDAVNNEIKIFLTELSKEFSLEEDKVLDFWNTRKGETKKTETDKQKKKREREEKSNIELIEKLQGSSKTITPPKSPENTDNAFDVSKLEEYNLTRLKAICKNLGIVQKGTKDEIISNIRKHQTTQSTITTSIKTEKKSVPLPKSGVLKTIQSQAPIIEIKRNKFGNYEHTESHLIFDKDDRMVIGKQLSDGSVEDITDEDIEICKKYKFSYKLPENLDKNKNSLKDVKLNVEEELNEDDMEEDEVELEDEDEEEVFEDDE